MNESTSTNLTTTFLTVPKSGNTGGLMEASFALNTAATSKIMLLNFRRRGSFPEDSSFSEMLIHGVRIDYFD